jgi:hypothetical protein
MPSILEQYALAASTQAAKQAEARRHAQLETAFRDDITSYHGPSIAFGLVLAGGAYPLVLAAIVLVAACVKFVWELATGYSSFGVLELAIIPFAILLHAGFCAVIGSIWTCIVAMVTLPIVYLFVHSLKLKGSIIWLGAVAGGLVGFIAVLPLTLGLPVLAPTIEPWHVAVILVLGPGLATIVGQLGGAWGGRRAERNVAPVEWKAVLSEVGEWQLKPVEHEEQNVEEGDVEEPRLQFGMRHILWIFVWLSLLLSVIRLSGIPFQFVLPLLVGWLLYQSATLYFGSRFFKWRASRSAQADQPFHVEPLAN